MSEALFVSKQGHPWLPVCLLARSSPAFPSSRLLSHEASGIWALSVGGVWAEEGSRAAGSHYTVGGGQQWWDQELLVPDT